MNPSSFVPREEVMPAPRRPSEQVMKRVPTRRGYCAIHGEELTFTVDSHGYSGAIQDGCAICKYQDLAEELRVEEDTVQYLRLRTLNLENEVELSRRRERWTWGVTGAALEAMGG